MVSMTTTQSLIIVAILEMSLICETIVSSDELSRDNNEEELDFDEEIHEDKDEGELDDDEDLEEGEVKDEEEDQTLRPKEVGNNRQNSICRFYGRGQCTWGNNCRFVHPTGGIIKRAPPPPPPVVAINPQLMRRREFFQENSQTNESAWERGLKQAKEMIVRASRRKEEELDFEDKRFNLNSNEEQKSREYTEEYERRRRLAFESAPWNNEEPNQRTVKNPETYRDPWRRSKSPQKRRLDSSSKRSHSMSSISASGSDSSEFSGSEGSESFSSSGSNISGHSGGQRKRFNRKTEEKKKKSGITSSGNNWNKSEKSQENYDSWSESLSDSESISSYYSGSDSDNEKRIQKRPQKVDKKDRSDAPPLKKVKTNQKIKSVEQQEAPKKSPIKMTFMKKKQSLKKEISSLAFNGRVAEEELIQEEEEECDTPPPVSPRTNNRREELLQQLRAVEDAIARKRSKIN